MLIKGEQIVVKLEQTESVNELGEYLREYTEVTVDDVLVQPTSYKESDGMAYDLVYDGTLTLHIPDSFTEDMRGAIVTLRGKDYRVIDTPEHYTTSPLKWNRHIVVEPIIEEASE